MVTKTDQEKRFFDLTAQAIALVNQGKRNTEEIDWLNNHLQHFKERTPKPTFAVTINYDIGLELMIEDGHYDWKNSNITAKNFPVDGKGDSAVNTSTVTIELVHFHRTMESYDVLRELDKQGLRPATLPELLAFGATYPEKQREFPVVALGSVWRDLCVRLYVAYLYSLAGDRKINLYWYEDRWYGHYRFAAVRKTEEYPVTVNYDRSIEEMVVAGKYDWKNSDITAKNFPVDGKGTSAVSIELAHFNRVMKSDEVLRELDKMGLRTATLPELLAFGATYPEKQREFPVAALGSVWRDWNNYCDVAYLWGKADGRGLNLGWYENRWIGSYRFAAVRKGSK